MPPDSYLAALQRGSLGSPAPMSAMLAAFSGRDDILVLEQALGLWGHLQARINLFAPHQGKSLPPGTFRNLQGRLIRAQARVLEEKVNFDALAHEVEYNLQHLFIICFVNGLPLASG
jgi:hypothetical protein